jgi:hypothetical protein
MLSFWQFMTLVLAALGLTMTSAQVLEMPQKMAYIAELYSAVNTTLYLAGAAQSLGIRSRDWIRAAPVRVLRAGCAPFLPKDVRRRTSCLTIWTS